MRAMTERAGFRALHPSVSRRQLLRIGGLGSLGLTLPSLLRAEAGKPSPEQIRRAAGVLRPIRSCILIFHYGGPSHIDLYDMKPNAPAEIRGQFVFDCNLGSRDTGVRASFADGEGDGPSGNRAQHAPSDDESQCSGIYGTLWP